MKAWFAGISLICLGAFNSHAQEEYQHPGEIVVKGHMSADQVLKGFQSSSDAITTCYETHLIKKKKAVPGRLTVEFTVKEKTGKIEFCKVMVSKGLDEKNFLNCAKQKACGMKTFPVKPKMDTDIQYPLVLTP
jgi:hypothetical protein